MLEFFVVLLFALLLVALWGCYYLHDKLKSTRQTAARLIANLHSDLREGDRKYSALEEGMDELEDSYQQMALDQWEEAEKLLQEKLTEIKHRDELIVQLKATNQVLADDLEYHSLTCLPDLTTMRLESLIRRELEAAIP